MCVCHFGTVRPLATWYVAQCFRQLPCPPSWYSTRYDRSMRWLTCQCEVNVTLTRTGVPSSCTWLLGNSEPLNSDRPLVWVNPLGRLVPICYIGLIVTSCFLLCWWCHMAQHCHQSVLFRLHWCSYDYNRYCWPPKFNKFSRHYHTLSYKFCTYYI